MHDVSEVYTTPNFRPLVVIKLTDFFSFCTFNFNTKGNKVKVKGMMVGWPPMLLHTKFCKNQLTGHKLKYNVHGHTHTNRQMMIS
jgi:hypothetical protein